MHISFVIPTRNRAPELAHTLARLGALDPVDLMGAELVVVDNGSGDLPDLPGSLPNAIAVTRVELRENLGTGARNIGAQHARGDWIVMLDDDSNLCPGPIGSYLASVDEKLAAVGGEITLPDGSHEAGGLPEVIVGCGCAIRRDAYIEVGGYDESFGYYAEEYDLCAKLISAGHAVIHTRAMRFEHRKVAAGRDMDQILYRLVRNNGWVIQRYAPVHQRVRAMSEMLSRYEQIAVAEHATRGYQRGLNELGETLHAQPRRTMTQAHWNRFVGDAVLRDQLTPRLEAHGPCAVAIVGPPRGKGLGQIRETIERCGCTIGGDDSRADIRVVGTLSPGPMLQTLLADPGAVGAWEIEPAGVVASR